MDERVCGTALMRIRQQTERGQAAAEFVFALVILLAFVAVLFQALHFELDAFNKSALLRYKALRRARVSQYTTEPYKVMDVLVEGKPLSDLTFYTVPFQERDLSETYGPKKLVIRHGTIYWDPTPIHAEWAFAAATVFDHREESSGYIGRAFGALGPLYDLVPP